jgi:hypothetical protein
MEGLPEIVMERPCEGNNWKWTWAICAPEASWGEYDSGSSRDEDVARENARKGYLKVIHKHFPEDYRWAAQAMHDDRRRVERIRNQKRQEWMDRINGQTVS